MARADETRHMLMRLNAELVLVATVLGDCRLDRARTLHKAWRRTHDPDHLLAFAETLKGVRDAYDLAEDAARQLLALTSEEIQAECRRDRETEQRLDRERADVLQ